MTLEIIRLIFEFVLSGTLIVTLVTLRSTRQKAQQDARKSTLDNDKALMNGFQEFIVEPLKKEVNALRKDVRRLNRAIDKANTCDYTAACPVRLELQNAKDNPEADDANAKQ
ncbi:MAG: hypothetical protein IKN91_03275 [Paludibacteraceae bacterium]|nr:hypothetical protein [Paludibacteraceae bacterium]